MIVIPPTISKDLLKCMIRFRIKVSHRPQTQREVNNLFKVYAGILDKLNEKAKVNTFEMVRFKVKYDQTKSVEKYGKIMDIVVNVNGPPKHANRASYAKMYRPGVKAVQQRMDTISSLISGVYAVMLPKLQKRLFSGAREQIFEIPTFEENAEIRQYLSVPSKSAPYWSLVDTPPDGLVEATGLHLGDIQKLEVVSEERGIEVLANDLRGFGHLDDVLEGFRGFTKGSGIS
ncbi:unnamed protein product [Kuraishia capsulata CBS 1993]|uniref:Uncharacterized protein n=1 Tax=Kuraishia capsulata CBS 1993 TaxID=1382522 RepID=W6MH95_9ASCO|nr:uncharacterized protein KUCA_T00001300001 [Kuraishia capsulata CBS 1993]CDK25331.1 unnamed protein product [Kuraishia capsulata CBS 1993]